MLLVLFRSLVVLFLILRVLTCMRMVAFLMQTVPFCMLGGVGRRRTESCCKGTRQTCLAIEACVKQNQTDSAFLYAASGQVWTVAAKQDPSASWAV